MSDDILTLGWEDVDVIADRLALKVRERIAPPPSRLIAISRGGLVPGALLAHRLSIRDVEAVGASTTFSDLPNAEKGEVGLRLPAALPPAEGPALLIDDIVGSGRTLRAVDDALAKSGVRTHTLACVVNLDNWEAANEEPPESAVCFVGRRVRQWVRFPWERR